MDKSALAVGGIILAGVGAWLLLGPSDETLAAGGSGASEGTKKESSIISETSTPSYNDPGEFILNLQPPDFDLSGLFDFNNFLPGNNGSSDSGNTKKTDKSIGSRIGSEPISQIKESLSKMAESGPIGSGSIGWDTDKYKTSSTKKESSQSTDYGILTYDEFKKSLQSQFSEGSLGNFGGGGAGGR